MMGMRVSKIPEKNLLPFETIEAATHGDSEALSKVLSHFQGYITKMSMRYYRDEYGQSYQGVDDELKRRIECRLIAQIVQKFKI